MVWMDGWIDQCAYIPVEKLPHGWVARARCVRVRHDLHACVGERANWSMVSKLLDRWVMMHIYIYKIPGCRGRCGGRRCGRGEGSRRRMGGRGSRCWCPCRRRRRSWRWMARTDPPPPRSPVPPPADPRNGPSTSWDLDLSSASRGRQLSAGTAIVRRRRLLSCWWLLNSSGSTHAPTHSIML